MHEVALVAGAVEQAVAAARRAGARYVEQLTFALDPNGHVSQDAVTLLVEVLGRGTPIEGARVVFLSALPSHAAELTLTSIDVITEERAVAAPEDASPVQRRA